MGSEDPQLHIFFFPFMAHGHMIPTLNMAKLFASRGAKATIITTPLNVPFCQRSIQRSNYLGLEIAIRTLKFPASEAGLPQGCENLDVIIRNYKPESEPLFHKFLHATSLLKDQLEHLIAELRPDCIVSDMFFPWTTDSAARFNVPRLVFHGISNFALCASMCVRLYEPHKKASSEYSDTFIIPNLPGDITINRKQTGHLAQTDENDAMSKFMKQVADSGVRSFGIVVNSFYELEPAYADYYREKLGRRAWNVGPLSLCNRRIEEKLKRGKAPSMEEEHECLKWLDSKKADSVVYVAFGSLTNFTDAQLMEIAKGLEASEKDFVWVVRRDKVDNQEWLPDDGFEDRIKDKGMIISGWAPQALILEHQAIGAFVTHCGWNSMIEGITAGVPMATWPVAAEQFYNEKFVKQVLGIGVSVGVKEYVKVTGDFVAANKVVRAVKELLMEGEEAEERRKRARTLGELAEAAVGKGGSSHSQLSDLIAQLRHHRRTKKEDSLN